MPLNAGEILRYARTALRMLRAAPRPATASSRKPSGPATQRRVPGGGYPGDYRGIPAVEYSPRDDGRPDPGEIVWAWVPYEDDFSRGKDRPVLVIAYHGDLLLALMLTTRDRNNGSGRDDDYIDIGTGAWDPKRRPSEVKLDRILQLNPADVRRNGAALERERFQRVAERLRAR